MDVYFQNMAIRVVSCKLHAIMQVPPLDGTHLVAMRGLIHQEVPTSASTSGAPWSNAAMSDDKDKHLLKYFAKDWIRC